MYIQFQPNRFASGIPISAISIHVNLFFLRIMMEHSYFIQASLTPRDKDLNATLEKIRNSYAGLLKQTATLANGVIRKSALESGQYVTPHTLEAEKMTAFLTGMPIDTSITTQERSIRPDHSETALARADEKAKELSGEAYRLTRQLADLKKKLLLDVVKCKAYTSNFPSELYHMWEEANKYLEMLEELESGKNIMRVSTLKEDEVFWSHIMADHSRFTASRLDSTEMDLIRRSLLFAQEFDEYTAMAKRAQEWNAPGEKLVLQTLDASRRLQDFQIEGTMGIMDCSIQSLIPPVRSDHHVRETYFFIWLLEMAQKAVA